MNAPNRLGAGEALREIRAGRLRCEELMRATLDEIRRREPVLKAWVRLDEERAMKAAQLADQVPLAQRGALHGLPLALKDTYDTADFATEWGGRAWIGRQPVRDATMVERAHKAGAIVIGKTVTTEYALLHPGPTTNPHNPLHTPGGSSSGSAAAVAACTAALGFGSQTNGSMLRPASYCGVYGIKPTFGLLPRTGLQPISAPLDTAGVFSRDLEGMAIALESLAGHDVDDAGSLMGPVSGLLDAVHAGAGRGWNVVFCRTPAWSRCDADARARMEDFVTRLRGHVEVSEAGLPAGFDKLHENHMVIQDSGLAGHLYAHAARAPGDFSDSLLQNILRGQAIPASRLAEAQAYQEWAKSAMDEFLSGMDVVIGLAATGEAPLLATTGDPAMQTTWTFTGAPSISVPALRGAHGLPIGVQVCARRGRDAEVMGFSAFLEACGMVPHA